MAMLLTAWKPLATIMCDGRPPHGYDYVCWVTHTNVPVCLETPMAMLLTVWKPLATIMCDGRPPHGDDYMYWETHNDVPVCLETPWRCC